MTHSLVRIMNLIGAACFALLLAACIGGGSSGGGGGSGSGVNRDFPGSIVGERIEFTVTEKVTESSVAVGLTVVYDFSVDGRVQGTNPETGEVLEPLSYSYEVDGSNATIVLFYDYSTGDGFEEYQLTGDDSIAQGTYEYEAVVTSPDQYSAGKAKGTYRIVPPNNVGIYPAPNATALTVEQEEFLRRLTREDDIEALDIDSNRDSYAAIQKDGTLITDILSERDRETVVGDQFLTPPGGQFVSVEAPALYLGEAISDSGKLWLWGGDSVLSPQVESRLDLPVHGFVEQSLGALVITGADRSPEYVCQGGVGNCRSNLDDLQADLDALNLSDIDKAIAPGGFPVLLYTDINDGLLRLAEGCGTCSPPAIATGVGAVIDFDLASPSFVVAIEATGQVVAWDWSGSRLPVPSEVGDDAVDLAISGDYVAVVRADGTPVTWRYDLDAVEAVDVDVPTQFEGASKVETSLEEGHFLFL